MSEEVPSPTTRFGKYDLETRLGVGGMAEVWLARQKGTDGASEQVVIKRILPGLADDPDFIAMFLREARLAAVLNHPNVVQIFDLGMFERVHYLVMEYIEGTSLRHLENQTAAIGKTLELGFVASVLAGACAGLHHAHEQRGENGEPLGLVHRDVAPDNLLVSYDGEAKVIDFGIAKAVADVSRTRSGVVKGKYGYMSPEQVKGTGIDRRSDVYAMGVVLFEALVGRRPFVGSPTETLHAILTQEPPPLIELRPDLPPEMIDLVARTLRKNPDERPQTIQEVGDVLAGVASQEGWEQSNVARVVRILSGTWKGTGEIPAVAAVSVPEPTRAARGQQDTDQASVPVVGRAKTEELDLHAPLLGLESAEPESRSVPPDRLSSMKPIHSMDEQSSPTLLSYPETGAPEFDRTELAGQPGTPPKKRLRSLLTPTELRVLLVAFAVLGALMVYRYLKWRQTRDDAEATLTIESRPSGSEIWVDGLPTGKYTPSVLEWDSRIKHTVLLKSAGHADTRREVPAGQPSGVLSMELAPVGFVRVTTQPPGAKLVIDGEVVGDSPRVLEVPADASTKISAVLDGYLDASTTVTVAAAETMPWTVTLVSAGRLDISSDPPAAKVVLDGQLVGRTPVSLPVSAGGLHALQIEAPGVDVYRVNASVEARHTRRIVAHLTDKEERRLQTLLVTAGRQLEDVQRQLRAIDANPSKDYFANMANLKRRGQLENRLDQLLKRRDEIQGEIDAHRNELEDRVAK